jgi:hypothetical protein
MVLVPLAYKLFAIKHNNLAAFKNGIDGAILPVFAIIALNVIIAFIADSAMK